MARTQAKRAKAVASSPQAGSPPVRRRKALSPRVRGAIVRGSAADRAKVAHVIASLEERMQQMVQVSKRVEALLARCTLVPHKPA